MPDFRPVRLGRAVLIIALLTAAAARPAAAAEAILFRIFLRDGTTVVSYGEYARVAGDVVFSLPLAEGAGDQPSLQLVTLPDDAVDWDRTEAYAEAARARHFAETRGEVAFGELSEDVAAALNAVTRMSDPAARLAAVERARRQLAEWPAQHYGYRAADVAQFASVLDEVVSQLRVSAGLSTFDVSLVASTTPLAPVPLQAPPTLRESVEQAFVLARLTPDSVQRTTLLEAISRSLDESVADAVWATALRARARAELAQGLRVDRAYASLTARMIRRAGERAARVDVRGLERLIRDTLEADDRLGRQRPQQTAALLATLDKRLEATRRHRLALDSFAVQRRAVRAYESRAREAFRLIDRARDPLEAIQRLAGPAPRTLRKLEEDTAAGARLLALVQPSRDVESVHALLTGALQMAARAAVTRARAVAANDMSIAWQASSAAAGALLMADRARAELTRLSTPPTL